MRLWTRYGSFLTTPPAKWVTLSPKWPLFAARRWFSFAVADYAPAQTADDKLKKIDDGFSLPLRRTQDILGWLGEHRREEQILCGFSMETRDLVENSRIKLVNKKVDLICANDLKRKGAGFAVDTNALTLISAKGFETTKQR